MFIILGCFSSPAAAISKQITQSAGDNASYSFISDFLNLSMPQDNSTKILDYTFFSDGAIFFIADTGTENSITIRQVNQNSELIWEKNLNTAEGNLIGSVYCNEENLYFSMKTDEDIKVYEINLQSKEQKIIYSVKNENSAMRLFGEDKYLCWYEENNLKVFNLETMSVERSIQTNGNEDYGSVQDGYLTYAYEKLQTGETFVKSENLDSGESYEVESLLGENTYSEYGNSEYIVYKEKYCWGAEIYIYERATEETKSLWHMLESNDEKQLRNNNWGINLIGNRLILCGDGRDIYSINLSTAEIQKISPKQEGIGYYATRNNGNAMASMLYKSENNIVGGTGNIYVGRMIRNDLD